MKYIVAIIACIIFWLIYEVFGAVVLGWKYGGGGIAQIGLLIFLGAIWRGITKNWEKATAATKAKAKKAIAVIIPETADIAEIFHGKWESTHYSVEVDRKKCIISEMGKGKMRFPSNASIIYDDAKYQLSYSDPYTHSLVEVTLVPIGVNQLQLMITRDSIVVETRESLARV